MTRRETTHHRAGAMAGAALLLAVSACTAASPQATASPSVAPNNPTPTISAVSSTPTPTASPAPSPTSSPITSSSASFNLLPVQPPTDFVSTITCSGSIGASDPVAIVRLQAAVEGTGDIVLRTYADPASPRTACTFGQTRIVQLIDARHVVIDGSSGAVESAYTYAVVDLPEVRFHWFQLPFEPEPGGWGPRLIAVSPGLDQVLWLTTHAVSETEGTDDVHITTSAGDRVVASVPRPIGGRCGSPEDSKQGAYTHSGAHLFVLDQPIPQHNSLFVIEGESEVLSVLPPNGGWPDGAHPAMAVWSPTSETLYYRQGSDIWRWTAGSNPELFLPGVSWYNPTITPDGTRLAYSVGRSDGLHDVYLVDLAHGGLPQLIGEGRNLPVFLNSTQLWYMSEGQGICGPGVDEPLIYSLSDSSESPSVVYRVHGVWPATSSNH